MSSADRDEPDYQAAGEGRHESRSCAAVPAVLIAAVPAGRSEEAGGRSSGGVADQRRDGDDDRERRAGDDRRKCEAGQRKGGGRVDHPAPDADDRCQDERDDGRSQALHGAVDNRDVPVLDVHRAHGAEDDERREHEEAARGDRATDAVERVPDVRRELLRLRAGERHAKVERVQEPALADPPAPLDELLVHDRDLAGRAAEADQAELEPEAEGTRLAGPDDLGTAPASGCSASRADCPRSDLRAALATFARYAPVVFGAAIWGHAPRGDEHVLAAVVRRTARRRSRRRAPPPRGRRRRGARATRSSSPTRASSSRRRRA